MPVIPLIHHLLTRSPLAAALAPTTAVDIITSPATPVPVPLPPPIVIFPPFVLFPFPPEPLIKYEVPSPLNG